MSDYGKEASMIPRALGKQAKQLAQWFPVVSITGPRQSGKSTLAKAMFPDYDYVNLENPETRKAAIDDPVGSIRQRPSKLIVDEAQYAPDLFSMIQVASDERSEQGQYVLSGSQNFLLLKRIQQSLAGRVGLVKDGVDARVIMPLYGDLKMRDKLEYVTNYSVPVGWRSQYCGLFKAEVNGVSYYFLDNEYYFKRRGLYGFYDDGERFAFFSRAVLETLFYIDFTPDIINCNDWQTALVPVYLNLYYRHLDKFNRIKTIFTIHNIAYQGKYGTDILEDTCGIGRRDQHIVEYDGCANFMKGAFETADKITTVSPTYAQEILDPWFSYGLDALLREKQYKLCGILNGIDMDANNPATDPMIPFNYDVTNCVEGKAKCKEALQDKFGLHKDGSPVFAMVSRMVGMKGFDLVQSIADGLVDRGIELVVLGSGEGQYENFFSELCARHPGRVGTYIGFEPALSQEIYAGADVFIMPSKSEPCGLAQMVACRYGTPPIVRETGGLRDSIHDCTLGEGNGFTFAGYSAHELYDACCRAQDRYYNKEDWNNLIKYDMECDFSWDLSAKSYEGLYNETANLW